jgi:4-amino-4-deoxy-L-arabinose transferase-like glycosyltransferase
MFNLIKHTNSRAFWLLFLIAAISFVFTLNLFHIGEEGVYTISSFEMWYNKHYLYSSLYGCNYGRPPLFNWLIISLAKVVGWSHMLLASRLVAAAITIGSGLVLAWLAKNIFHDKGLAAFSALAYLTTDALMYHGWLAYSDPLFAFCILVAVACLWVACEKKHFGLLAIAACALIAAFLTKALTTYVFYAVAFVLLYFFGARKFLLHPVSIILHLAAFSAPFAWALVTNNANGSGLVRDIIYWGLQANSQISITSYLQQLIAFPFEIFLRVLPVSLVALYYFWQNHNIQNLLHKSAIKFLILFVGINFLPYWLSAKHAVRFILPLYPFMVLWCSYIIWHANWRVNARAVKVALIYFIAAIIIKYLSVIFWWPQYQKNYRGDYPEIARDIIAKIGHYPIYANDAGAIEHSVFDNINIMRYPLPPVKNLSLRPAEEKDYFVVTGDKNFNSGKLVHEYSIGKSKLKLYLNQISNLDTPVY